MNIFAIEGTENEVDWEASARSQDNLRVNKMILESCQMLCTTLNEQHGHQVTPFKSCHTKHPSTRWAAYSSANWIALSTHCAEMIAEFERRFGHAHKCEAVLGRCIGIFDAARFDEHRQTLLPLCMPDEYKGDSIVESYRRYYASKPHIRYPKDRIPQWFHEYRSLPYIVC
jgi:hypothetical protein